MLKMFLDYEDVIHNEFILEGQTVNKGLYLDILKWLWDAVRWKQTCNWPIPWFFFFTLPRI